MALLVIVRMFALNMVSLPAAVEWLQDKAVWLRMSCDHVELFGSTGMAAFQ